MAPDAPGRNCPLSYRYSPDVFRRAPEIEAETLYVIGGLYGNPVALDAIVELAAQESPAPTLVFNGDFNWFDVDPGGFAALNARVLEHTALRGNVETELAGDGEEAGCGCAYPEYVGDADVARSNAILERLRETARYFPALRARLGGLPMHAVAAVGSVRIGIVHGDAWSLAGWRFAQERLDEEAIERAFDAADVSVFASSHTCLPVTYRVPAGVIANNGAAGMPNFRGTRFGLVKPVVLAVPRQEGHPLAPDLADEHRLARLAERGVDAELLGVGQELVESRPADDTDVRDRRHGGQATFVARGATCERNSRGRARHPPSRRRGRTRNRRGRVGGPADPPSFDPLSLDHGVRERWRQSRSPSPRTRSPSARCHGCRSGRSRTP